MKQNIEKLLAEVATLNNKSQFNEVILKLSPQVISDYNNGSLYEELGRANANLQNYNEAITLYTIAISLNPTATAYARRSVSYYRINDQIKGNSDIDAAFKIDNNNSIVFAARAIIHEINGDYKSAISDLSKSIELDPEKPLWYVNRGISYAKIEEYDNAIKDFDKAIQLSPENGDAYFNRGLTLQNLGKYAEAINDYNKSIELDGLSHNTMNLALSYNNRGSAWYAMDNMEKALEDFTTSIQVDPNLIYSYQNRGGVLYNSGNYSDALMDWKKALTINPLDSYSKYWIDLINAKNGEKITIPENTADKNIYLFKRLLDGLPDESRIMQLAVEITEECIEKIQTYAFDNSVESVAHYTKLKIADIIVSADKPLLRYYNAIYMNDPEEGEVLLECLDSEVRQAYDAGKKGEDSNIYLGSFLDAKEHKDELVMWRTYGKDENSVEAAGCSIVIKSVFFDKGRNRLITGVTNKSFEDIDDKAILRSEQPLYRVLYFDKRKKEFASQDRVKLQPLITDLAWRLKQLNAVKDNVNGEKSPKDKAIDKIVYHILSEIRYLFKSSDYSFENEYRVIQYATHPDIIKVDELSFPKRLYVESNNDVRPHIEEIILGAKVPRPEQWIYIDFLMKKNKRIIKLSKSTCKFQ